MLIFLLFYNKGTGKFARKFLDEDFKHCDVITYDGDLFLRLSWNHSGIEARRVKARSATALCRALRGVPELTALIVADCEIRVNHPWNPLIIRSCNELARYASGLDLGLTLTPNHLYRKVLKYTGKRNFEVLSAWRRDRYGMAERRLEGERI